MLSFKNRTVKPNWCTHWYKTTKSCTLEEFLKPTTQSSTSRICKCRFTAWHKWKAKICQAISDRERFPPFIQAAGGLSLSLSHHLDLSSSWQLSALRMSLIMEVQEGVFILIRFYNSISPFKSYRNVCYSRTECLCNYLTWLHFTSL